MNSDNDADFRWLIDVNVFMSPKSQVNWTTLTASGTYLNNGHKQSSGVQDDEIAWDVVLAKGTWTAEIVAAKQPNMGIASVQLNSVEVGTIDAYDVAGANNVRMSVTGIVVAESGVKELKLKMATKNASSSAYYLALNHLQLRRTA